MDEEDGNISEDEGARSMEDGSLADDMMKDSMDPATEEVLTLTEKNEAFARLVEAFESTVHTANDTIPEKLESGFPVRDFTRKINPQINPTEELKSQLVYEYVKSRRPKYKKLYCCNYNVAERDKKKELLGPFCGAHLCMECSGAEYRLMPDEPPQRRSKY